MGNVSNNMAGSSSSRTGGLDGGIDQQSGTPYIYPSKQAAIADLVAKLDKYPSTRDKTYNPMVNYTSDFNSWILSTHYTKTTKQEVHATSDEGITFFWITRRTLEWSYCGGTVKVHSMGQSPILKDTANRTSWQIFYKVRQLQPVSQGDDGQGAPQESIQGHADQSGSKQASTIITADTTQEKQQPVAGASTVSFASTEPLTTYTYLTTRWMPYSTFEVQASHATGYELLYIWLPEMLYSKANCAPNNIPFETFVYGKTDVEIKVVVNGNKFQVGKLVVASKYDSYQADSCSDGYQGALTRNHVIIDLPARNEGVLTVPFVFRRSLLRLARTQDSTKAVRASKYASVSVKVLSPLQAGTGQPNTCIGQVFYRFSNAQFTGLSYRVTLQGDDNVGDAIANNLIPTKTLKAIVKGAEVALEQLGESNNQDKPTQPQATIIVPQPRRFFSSTGGLADCAPLRANPTALTTFKYTPCPRGEPKTTVDIARIFGLSKEFDWSASSSVGTVLLDMMIDPTLRFTDKDYTGAPTPLEYICGLYQFWSGTIELRFDFVSNAFHTGAVLISVEFNRPKQTETICAAASTYTTTFHLGEQRSVSIVVPYIYDTVFRRNNGVLINDNLDNVTSLNLKSRSYSMAALSQTKVRVVVLNPLRPPETVTQTIKVLVFQRGGKDIAFMGLKPTQYVDLMAEKDMNSFPRDYVGGVYTGNVNAQGDTGEKEDTDPTPVHNTGPCALIAQNCDANIHITTILRRPVVIIDQYTIKATSDSYSGCFIPVQPPSRSFCNRKSNTFIAQSVAYTPHTALLNLFRHWRGSTRYTIALTKQTKATCIMVTYLPHTGVRLVGNQEMGVSGSKISPYKMGMATELLVPNVNPTCHIEVPYETENDWTLVFEEDTTRNYTWRDKGDTNAGHLVIQALNEDIEVTVWWAAGDDFEVANWYGIPWCKSNDVQYRLDDNTSGVAEFTSAAITASGVTISEVTSRLSSVLAREKLATTTTSSTTTTTTPRTQGDIVIPLEPSVVQILRQERRRQKQERKKKKVPRPNIVTQGWYDTLRSWVVPEVETTDPLTGWTPQEREDILAQMPAATRSAFYELESQQDQAQIQNFILSNVYRLRNFRLAAPIDEDQNPVAAGAPIPGPSSRVDVVDLGNEEEQDFPTEHLPTQVEQVPSTTHNTGEGSLSQVRRLLNNRVLQNAALASIPMVGSGLVVARTCASVDEALNVAMAGVTSAVDSVSTVSRAVGDLSESVQEQLVQTQPLINNISQMSQSITLLANKLNTQTDVITRVFTQALDQVLGMFSTTVDVARVVFNFFLDLIVAWIDRSWTAVGVGLVRILTTTMGPNAVMNVMQYASDLSEALSNYFTHNTGVVVQADQADNTAAVIVSVLAGIVGTLVGVAVRPVTNSYIRDTLIRLTSTTGVAYFVQVTNFVKMVFKTMKEMIYSALGMVNPEAQALEALSGQSETLKLFIQNAQTITSEANTALVFVPEYRIKFWQTVLQAQRLQQMMIEVPNSCVSPVLSRLCADVIKVGNEKFLDLAACPVRYEPFVVCITGPSGVGKSHMTNRVICAMLDSIGYAAPASGVAYYRTPLSQYWSGYRDQPVVVYDEWMHMNDKTAAALQLAELFQLKSTSPFIPNMAHLEEKRIKGNPLIVVLLCNDAFPRLDEVNHKQAVWRRREEVFEVVVDEEFAGVNPRNMTPEHQENYAHVSFVRYTDPCDSESNTTDPKKFADFQQYLCDSFKRYHAQEQRNVARQMEQLNRLNRDVPPDAYNIRDPFSVFYSGVTPVVPQDIPEWIPTDRLRADVNMLVNAMDRFAQQAQLLPIPDAPVWEGERPRGDPNEFEEGMPDAQMDPLTAAAVCAVASTFSYATVGYLWATINQFAHTTTSILSHITAPDLLRGQCSVCAREDAPVSYLCRPVHTRYTETRILLHVTCMTCVQQCRAVGHYNCPVCRSEMLPVVTQEEMTWWMKGLRYLKNGLEGVVTLSEVVTRLAFTTQDWVRWWSLYELLLGSVECIFDIAAVGTVTSLHGVFIVVMASILAIHTADSYFRDVPLWPSIVYNLRASSATLMGETNMWARPNYATEPLNYYRATHVEDDALLVQVDPGEEYENELQVQPVQDVTYEKIERWCREENTEPGPCLHGRLVQEVDNATYNERWWYINYANQRVRVFDGPCRGHYCAWKPQPTSACTHTGIGLQRFFYRLYVQRRTQQLQNHYIAWTNAVGNQKNFVKNRIPRVLRPTWMLEPIELDQAMQNATSTTWWQWLSDAFAQYRRIFEILAIATAVSAVLYGVWVVGGQWLGAAAAATTATIGATATVQSPGVRQAAHVTRTRASRVHRGSYFATSQSEPQINDVVGRYIQNNTLLIKLMDTGGNCVRLLHAIGIYQHVAIMPGHYVSTICQWKGPIIIENMQRPFLQQPYTPSEKDFRLSLINDIALWYAPASTNNFKDIRKFLATDDDLLKPLASRATLYVVPTRHLPHMVIVEVDLAGIVNNMTVNNPEGGTVQVLDAIEYNFSKPGACGSLLLLERTQRPIVSMHVAGSGVGMDGVGYGLILTREAFGELEGIDTSIPDDVATQSEEHCEIIWPPHIQVDYCGAVETDKKPWVPTKSKLRKSSIFGDPDLAVDIEPAILSNTDPRYVHDVSPLVAGCEAHGRLTENFPSHWLDGPKDTLRAIINAMKPNILNPEVLTEEQAIIGLDMPYYDPIDINTSAGYPLTLTGKTSKHDWMEIERDSSERMIRARLIGEAKQLYDEASRVRQQGQRYKTIFTDTLKDEKRPRAKLMKRGGTRVFCNGPLEHMLHMRRYFTHFSAAFMMRRRELMHAVGINPCGVEWDQLARDMLKKGKKICTLDYTNFGPGFNACVAQVALDIIAEWTLKNVRGCNANEVYSLLAECSNSVHIAGNTVYAQTSGSPSGAVLTTVINSLVNQLYILVAWEQLTRKKILEGGLQRSVFKEFRQNVGLFVYGDDLVMSVSDEYIELFNSKTISDFFRQFKIVATDASKTSEIKPYTTLLEAEFLKRTWTRHPSRHVWMSKLRMDTLKSTTQWIWETANHKEATLLNCEVAVMMAHGLGPVGFANFRDTINRALARKHMEPILTTWKEVDDSIYEFGYVQVFW